MKKETFKYLLSNYFKSIIGKFKFVHDKLKQQQEDMTIPYIVFYEWIVEVLAYGVLMAVVYVDIFMLNGWLKWALFPFCLGSIRWLWMDFVENTSNAIKGKK